MEEEQTKMTLARFANCKVPVGVSDDDNKVHMYVNAILRQFHLLYEENDRIMQ